jgi:hypothetical protein
MHEKLARKSNQILIGRMTGGRYHAGPDDDDDDDEDEDQDYDTMTMTMSGICASQQQLVGNKNLITAAHLFRFCVRTKDRDRVTRFSFFYLY